MGLIITVFILILIAFIAGVLLRPLISRIAKKNFTDWFDSKYKRYEIEFKIEFYSQPSIHHLGETGMLVKTDPIKVQVDAKEEDEALTLVDLIVKQEVKSELISIKEIPRIH